MPSTLRLPFSGRPLPGPGRPLPPTIDVESDMRGNSVITAEPEGSLAEPERPEHRKLRAGLRIAKYAVGGLAALSLPLSAPIAAVELSPGQTIEAGGFTVNVTPEIGFDYSTIPFAGIFGGARSDGHVNVMGKSVAASVIPEGQNDIDPYNKLTREAWSQVYAHSKPLQDHVAAVAKENAKIYALGGLSGALITELGFATWALRRKHRYGSLRAKHMSADHRRDLKWARYRMIGFAMSVVLASAGVASKALLRNEHRTITGGTELYGLIKQAEPFLQLGQFDEAYDDQTTDNLDQLAGSRPDLEKPAGFVRFILADDIENNNGQARQFGHMIKLFKADYGVMLGDWATYEDRKIGMYTVDTAYFESGKAKIYTAGGNHETATGIHYAESNGIIIPNNKSVNIKDMVQMFIMSRDVTTINSFGAQSVTRKPKMTIESIVKKICAARPRLLFIHDHKDVKAIVEGTLAKNCAPQAVFSGRMDLPRDKYGKILEPKSFVKYFSRTINNQKITVTSYTNDSSAGNTNVPNFGPIKHSGDNTIIDYNPATGEMIATPLTFHTNTKVTAPAPKVIIPADRLKLGAVVNTANGVHINR